MYDREVDQWLVRCDRNAEVSERIVGDSGSNKIRLGGVKDRVRRVQNAIEARDRDISKLRSILDLTVPERSIVAPASVKELVAFDTDREKLGDVFLIDQAVTEIGKACHSETGDDLLKWIEWIECIRRHPSLRDGGRVRRRDSARQRGMRRDVECTLARILEWTRGGGRKFVMRLHPGVIEVAENPKLIIADFVLERRVAAPAFLGGKRTGERVKVKAREQTEGTPDTSRAVNVIACRSRSVGEVGLRPKFKISRI